MADPFFDLTIGGQTGARVIVNSRMMGGGVVMELHAETTPKTAVNLRGLRTGMKGTGKVGKPLHYKGKYLPKKKKVANRKGFLEGLDLKGSVPAYPAPAGPAGSSSGRNKTVEGSVPAYPAPAGPAGSSSGRNKTVERSVPAVPAPAGPAGSSSGRNKTVERSVPAVPAPAGPAGSSSGRNKTVEGSVPAVPKNLKKVVNYLEGLDLNKTVEGSVPAPAGPPSLSSVNCNLRLRL